MSTTLTCISGFRSKGPACFLLETQGRRILLDFGCGPDDNALPAFERIGTVDALVLSHGHRDHVGALPHLDRIGRPPVFATRWLHDQLREIRFGLPLPEKGETEIMGIRVETGRTGHAPGGVWLRFDVEEGLLYTGDYCPSSLLYAFDLPPPAAVALVDASYGADDQTLSSACEALLERVRGRPCLLPAPPDGRGPEMAMFLLSEGIEVGLDDATADAVRRLLDEPSSLKAGAASQLERLLAVHRPVNEMSEPEGAMVVAGASGNSGLARGLLDRWESDRRIGFVFTGHLPSGSHSAALVHEGRATSLRWNVHPRLAETQTLLSAVRARQVIPAFASSEKLSAMHSLLPVPFDMEGSIIAIA